VLGPEFESTLAGAQAGDEAALDAIYRDLYPSVLSYLRARTRRDAEDLASDVFVDVATGIGRFQGDETGFRGWVFTIARRRVIDAGRRSLRRATDPVAPSDLELHADGADPAAEAVTHLRAEEALAAVGRLPAAQAEVVLLRVVAGLSVEEAALAMDRRPGSVRVLQHRALRRLARILSDPEHAEEVERERR
jgi:RNA polymerase sigma-70 factor (ECF subfamily)